jgi:hypothetical protein
VRHSSLGSRASVAQSGRPTECGPVADSGREKGVGLHSYYSVKLCLHPNACGRFHLTGDLRSWLDFEHQVQCRQHKKGLTSNTSKASHFTSQLQQR